LCGQQTTGLAAAIRLFSLALASLLVLLMWQLLKKQLKLYNAKAHNLASLDFASCSFGFAKPYPADQDISARLVQLQTFPEHSANMAKRKQVKAVTPPSPEASDSDAGSSSAGSGQEEEEAEGSESSSSSDAGEEKQDDESISGSDSGDEGVAAAPASDDEEGSESSGIDMAKDGLEGQSDMSIDSDDCGWTSADEAMFGTVLGKRTQEPGAARSDDDDSDDSGSCFSDFEGDAVEKDGADVDDADEDEDEDEEEEEEEDTAADTAANTAANTSGAPRQLGGLTPDDAAASARAAKRAKQDLPSKDEQMQLNNTQSIMRTNLLRLQVRICIPRCFQAVLFCAHFRCCSLEGGFSEHCTHRAYTL